MPSLYVPWLAAGGMLAVYAAVNIVCFNCFAPPERYVFLKRVFLSSLPVVVVLAWIGVRTGRAGGWFVESTSASGGLHALGLLFLFFFSYWNLYSLVDRSISVRLSVEYHLLGNTPLTEDQIFKLYDIDGANRRRFDQMAAGGLIEPHEGKFRLTAKGRRVAMIDAFLKKLYRTGRGG